MVWLCVVEGSEGGVTARFSTRSLGSVVTGRSAAATAVEARTKIPRFARDDKRSRDDRPTRDNKRARDDDWGENPSGYSTTSGA